MPRVACLSCGDRDTVGDVHAIRPAGDWTCPNCDWVSAKIVPFPDP